MSTVTDTDRHFAPAQDDTVFSISDADLIKRAVKSARPRNRYEAPRWAAVMDAFGLGSTFAWQLCERFGLDPDEPVKGSADFDSIEEWQASS
jgi:hypothetical protein